MTVESLGGIVRTAERLRIQRQLTLNPVKATLGKEAGQNLRGTVAAVNMLIRHMSPNHLVDSLREMIRARTVQRKALF